MTSGFALPFPPVDHPDRPDENPSLAYAFHFWIQADLTKPLHHSQLSPGHDFYVWKLLSGALRLEASYVQRFPRLAGSAAHTLLARDTAEDTARMIPETANDFYWEGEHFDLKAVFSLVHGNASLIMQYTNYRNPSPATMPDGPKKLSKEESPAWKYARDPYNTPVPAYGAGGLKVQISLETDDEVLGQLVNNRPFFGYGTRLLATDGLVRTIYRVYTPTPFATSPNFQVAVPAEIHPSVGCKDRTCVMDVWMRGDVAGLKHAYPFPDGRQFSIMSVVEGEMYVAPNTYPASTEPTARLLPDSLSDWMLHETLPGGVGRRADVQMRCIWRTKNGHPLWLWYRGGAQDTAELEAFSQAPLSHAQIPFGVGDFHGVVRMATTDPSLQWVQDTRFHFYGTRILQANGDVRTTYKVYKENEPVPVEDVPGTWGRPL